MERGANTVGTFCAVYAAFAAALLCAGHVDAAVCDVAITTCPENLDGSTLVLPEDAMALSARVLTCEPTEIIEGLVDSSRPPSIFFVIDHSHSMQGLGRTYPGMDPYGSRFSVVRDLLDTIYAEYPNAEVGVAVFREVLYFDHRNNNLFTPLVGQGDQSYLPLLRLNSTVGGRQAIDAIKDVLATDTVVLRNRLHDIDVECVDLVYKPLFTTMGNTNINNAFDAARQAFTLSSNPRDRQFIIFLSDGEPFPLDLASQGGKDPFYFVEGTNTPTTFTVYFTDQPQAPQSIVDMTANIRVNNYSVSNPASDLWTVQTSYDTLMSLMMSRVVGLLLQVTTGEPTRLSVNGLVSTVFDDSVFVFADRFALNADTTRFNLAISYTLTNVNTGATRDTVVPVRFTVVRKAGALTPDGVALVCREQATLALHYRGAPVSAVNETMDTLQVVFSANGVAYDSVRVSVTHVSGTSLDSERLTLSLTGATVWNGAFRRSIDEQQRLNDGVLQHDVFDSIVVIYRNPEVPLDTIRLSVPFAVTNAVVLQSATWYDRNADGYIDSIGLVIDGQLREDEIGAFMALLTLPSWRGFTGATDSIVRTADGLALRVSENRGHVPQTGTALDTVRIRSGRLTQSGWVMPLSIRPYDMVAPVIVSARLRDYENQVDPDSLTVIFSEQVNRITFREPYLFYGTAEATSYRAYFTIDGAPPAGRDTVSLPVASVFDGALHITRGDSVWINPSAIVADTGGIRQLHAGNRKVPISVVAIREPYQLVPSVSNNPMRPAQSGESNVPDFILALDEVQRELQGGRYGNNGMVIMAEPGDPTKVGANFTLEGTISIYDIVNNPVLLNRPMAFDNAPGRPRRLYYVWDGRSHTGRYVGAGTYLAVLRMKDEQGYSETKTVRLGVAR